MPKLRLRIGTRASALARWQADWVAAQLTASGVEVELVPITTRGDATQRESIASIGSPGVFTKELQRALGDRQIDLAVHSLKDLPTDIVDGLVLAAVPPRESPRDALVSRGDQRLENLAQGARIGTGSLRRKAQLWHRRPDLHIDDVRGNVDTRLKKLADGQYDALVLAHAGLKRLGFDGQISELLKPDVVMPAVGQGALGIEARSDDLSTQAALAVVDDHASHQAVIAERALLAALSGGCLAPIGGLARVAADGQLRLEAVVLSPDGRRRLAASATAPLAEAVSLGRGVAQQLLSQGAGDCIVRDRQSN
jgi:hydroxymethylbilane synthase